VDLETELGKTCHFRPGRSLSIFIKELSPCSLCASAQALKYLQLTRRAFRRLRSRPWTVAIGSTSNSAHSRAITAPPVTRSLAAGPRPDTTETARLRLLALLFEQRTGRLHMIPPLTRRFCPVIQRASSLTKSATTSEISWGRRRGCS